MDDKAKQTLLQFFTISCGAFDFQRTLFTAFGRSPHLGSMEALHRKALSELQKDEPNIAFVDLLLAKMEEQADTNKRFNEAISKQKPNP